MKKLFAAAMMSSLLLTAACAPVSSNLATIPTAQAPTVTEQNADGIGGGADGGPSGSARNAVEPFDYMKLQEPVLIRLDEDHRLTAPIQTIVAPRKTAYSLFFREPMNKSSVEAALRANLNKRTDPSEKQQPPSILSFDWVDEQYAKLTVDPLANREPDSYYLGEYELSIDGAKTKSGKEVSQTPAFHAVLDDPRSLWRISTETGAAEKLDLPDTLYTQSTFIGKDRQMLLLQRFKETCQCDALTEKIQAIYDFTTRQVTPFPFEISDQYRGQGSFIADSRGFFYPLTAQTKAYVTPDSVRIDIPEFVHGASFSKDYKRVLIAAGDAEQKKGFDFIIYDLATKKQTKYPAALPYYAEESMVTSQIFPIAFADNGKQVVIPMMNPDDVTPRWLTYSWDTQKISEVSSILPPEELWSFSLSPSGKYQIVNNEQIYQDSRLISRLPYKSAGEWMPQSDRYVYQHSSADSPLTNLSIVDLQTGQTKPIVSNLEAPIRFVGADPSEKWVYVFADAWRTALK